MNESGSEFTFFPQGQTEIQVRARIVRIKIELFAERGYRFRDFSASRLSL